MIDIENIDNCKNSLQCLIYSYTFFDDIDCNKKRIENFLLQFFDAQSRKEKNLCTKAKWRKYMDFIKDYWYLEIIDFCLFVYLINSICLVIF